jgi:hypothetical protein
MIKFKLPELDLSQYKKLYCGKETRLATATSVSFVDYNTILVPSLLGKKIYLIDINNNSFNIIDEIDCGVYIDLIDFKDNTIITANALSPEHIDGSISIFKLENRKIKFIKEIIVKKNLRVHGCRFIDNDNIIVASNDKLNSGIYFINLNTNEHTNYVKFNDRVKDILIKDDKLLIITSENAPTKNGEYIDNNSTLYIYDLQSMKKLGELVFEGQVDSICMNDNNGFITVQGKHSLLHFELNGNELIYKKYISGFNFPHGIATMDDKVIITNYGDNSVDIYELEELIKD